MGDLLAGRTAVITGAGRGIGRGIAELFAEQGANVVACDMFFNDAEAYIGDLSQFGTEIRTIELDVTKTDDVKKVISSVKSEFGRIDIWVNNAGINDTLSLEDVTEDVWDRVMNIDLKAVFFCSQAVFPIMKEQNYGRIINISSISGERGGRESSPAYSAAKAGVMTLAKCFAMKGGPYNITANALCPGTIQTDMLKNSILLNDARQIPLGRFGVPQDVAGAALFFASDLGRYVTGTALSVNGGLYMGR